MTPDTRAGLVNLPNTITLLRIAATPALFFLALAERPGLRFAAFLLFVAAGLSDVWDGYLARKHGWVTDVGKLLDPLADKLLMFASFLPLYIVSHRGGALDAVPWWGTIPLWVLIVIFGRELEITLLRQWAQRKGVLIAAGRSGKLKTLFQSFFVGGLFLWYPLRIVAEREGWVESGGWAWAAWSTFHGAWVGVTLAVAIVLTIYSMFEYLWDNRSLLGVRM